MVQFSLSLSCWVSGKLPKRKSICMHACYACQLNSVMIFLCSTTNISTRGLNSTLSDYTSWLGPRLGYSTLLGNYDVQGIVLCYTDTDLKNDLSSKEFSQKILSWSCIQSAWRKRSAFMKWSDYKRGCFLRT